METEITGNGIFSAAGGVATEEQTANSCHFHEPDLARES